MAETFRKLWAETWVRAITTVMITAVLAWGTTVVTMKQNQVRQEEQIHTIQDFVKDTNSYMRSIESRLSRIEGKLDGQSQYTQNR